MLSFPKISLNEHQSQPVATITNNETKTKKKPAKIASDKVRFALERCQNTQKDAFNALVTMEKYFSNSIDRHDRCNISTLCVGGRNSNVCEHEAYKPILWFWG